MADNNQQFKVRATSAAKGVFEVTPSESTILAKSLVDIAAMLKEIKEGQAAASKPLRQHANTCQQVPVKHCGICSRNSHYTDECPQLQEDQTIAASHNFYDNQQSPPNNRQYYPQPQGWHDNQKNRWNPPQQPQQNQFHQPYTYNQPQNPQNQRYQPPHTRQTYHPPNERRKKEKKKKKQEEGKSEKKVVLQCSSFDKLLGKLKIFKKILHHHKSMDAHLVKDNSKWK
ncbi:hypothetical protein PIB30_094270 [Stylosanthes scabra]|uniref:CCHC-type domain-containing protein n=1 Tax=Stylosanthes scabra TaxID=79078 RepID=A0ABU6WY58_9FABA|nr:hypothetical protein [Stylosanthes scabra]